MYGRGPRLPQFKLNNLFNEHFPLANFFFFASILCVKTGEVEVIVIEKWYSRWLWQLTILFPGRTYIALEHWF